jgi:hypothetical protein
MMRRSHLAASLFDDWPHRFARTLAVDVREITGQPQFGQEGISITPRRIAVGVGVPDMPVGAPAGRNGATSVRRQSRAPA